MSQSKQAVKVLMIVVRYKIPLSESKTIQGIVSAFEEEPSLVTSYDLQVWDNSPEALVEPRLPISFRYQHSPLNLGIAGACNAGLDRALAEGHSWMLLFDQDSTVTASFLRAMAEKGVELLDRTELAAIAPTVTMGHVVASPRLRGKNGQSYIYPAGECGVAAGEAIAVNSGSLVRPQALKKIGGFSTDFWLDYSDIYVYHQFFLHGFKIWRAADIQLEHEMTMHDYDRLLKPWRYRNFSFAETAFFDLYASRTENLVQYVRLVLRAIKQRIKYKNPAFWQITLEQLLYRIKVRRKKRLVRWYADGERRRNGDASIHAIAS